METPSLTLDVAKSRQSGIKSLAWQPSLGSFELSPKSVTDLRAADDFRAAVAATPPAQIYHAILEHGISDCQDVIQALTNSQLTKILDYDTWKDDTPDIATAITWFNNFPVLADYNTIYERYQALDEEYQIAFLEGKIRLYDEEEMEVLTPEISDQLRVLPCNTLWYLILDDNPEVQLFIEKLIESSLSKKIEYTYSLLAHVAYDVPHENAFLLDQFRTARMEEDGFVSEEESLSTFKPINFIKVKADINARYGGASSGSTQSLPVAANSSSKGLFLDQVRLVGQERIDMERLTQQLLFLSNSLCSASKIKPDDRDGLLAIMEQARSLVSLGLEFLSDSDPELAVSIIATEHPKSLFRVALSVVALVQQKTLETVEEKGLGSTKRLLSFLQMQKWALLHNELDVVWLDTLGLQLIEVIRGLCNRYPMMPRIDSGDDDHIKFQPISSIDDLNAVTQQFEKLLEELIPAH